MSNYADHAITVILGAIIVTLISAFLAVGYVVSSYQCTAQWRHSGMATSWGPFQGCLVQLPGGRWVPAKAVREVDIEGPK